MDSEIFKKWKLDLDGREKQWMDSHPEGRIVDLEELCYPRNVHARIEESKVIPFAWNLYLEEKLIEIFYPPNAQMHATAALGKLLNEK